MKLKKIMAAALLAVMAVVTAYPTGVAEAAEINSYTYNYDYWDTEYESPDAYQPTDYIDGRTLGTTPIRQPKDMFIQGNSIYVVDSGNNRILEILVEGETTTLVREITEVVGDLANVRTSAAAMRITAVMRA